MKTLNLDTLDFCSKDQSLRITISWDKDTLPALISNQEERVNNIKVYQLNSEQLEFAKKYHLPFKYTYYSLTEVNNFIALLEEYEELVIEAEARNLNWNFKKFDFEGLKELVEQEIERKKDTKDTRESSKE